MPLGRHRRQGIWLVGKENPVDVRTVVLRQFHTGVTIPAGVKVVLQAGVAQEVAGVRGMAAHHPRIPPDRDGDCGADLRCGPDQGRRTPTSQSGIGQCKASTHSRSIEANAAGTVSITMTHTWTPASRSRRASSSRFSCLLANTRSGSRVTIAQVRVLRASDTGEHKTGRMGAPVNYTNESRRVAVTASVNQGTRDKIRFTLLPMSTGLPKSSVSHIARPSCSGVFSSCLIDTDSTRRCDR